MAKAKKEQPHQQPDDEAEAAASLKMATDVAGKTLTGDMRDFILNRLQHEQDKRPWNKRSEDDQRTTIAAVESACVAMVTKAVELIAAGGRRTIKATLSQVTVKDGIRAQLEISRQDERRHHLVDAQGSTVLIVVADTSDYEGEREPVHINHDQGDLVRDVAVVHSDAEVPFH